MHFLELKGFLTEPVHDKILSTDSGLTEHKKAVEVVRWITRRVGQDKQSFHTLVDWFKKHGEHYQPIVRILEAEYKKQVSAQCQCSKFAMHAI